MRDLSAPQQGWQKVVVTRRCADEGLGDVAAANPVLLCMLPNIVHVILEMLAYASC
jgi:hypothetical protein